MRKTLLVFTSLFIVFVLMFISATNTIAVTDADIKNQQKKAQASEQKLKSLQSEITVINKKLADYNAKIVSINNKISANKSEIAKKEAEIENDKLEFKKRLRAIRMSNSESSIRILLGAKSFSQFLQLTQLTSSVSARDKAMIRDLSERIKEINAINDENQKLLDKEVAAKNEIAKQQEALSTKEQEAKKIYENDTTELKALQEQKKKEDAAIAARAKGSSGGVETPQFTNNSGDFLWPVKDFTNISAGFQSNDAVHRGHHNGIDITGGGISGQPIRAISDGYVSYVCNQCSHNYSKNYSCGCGSGYGNYCIINHGTIGSAQYSAYYAHATKIIVSPGQKVAKGQTIGYVGTTGWSTGYHLHFGLLVNGKFVNPINYKYQK